jgi:hypothetical protein
LVGTWFLVDIDVGLNFLRLTDGDDTVAHAVGLWLLLTSVRDDTRATRKFQQISGRWFRPV